MPRQGMARVSTALQNISVKYSNEQYIAPLFMKDLPVIHDSDEYYVYNKDFYIEQMDRANGARSNQATWSMSTSSYKLQKWSLSDVITNDDRDNTDNAIDLDIDTTEFLTDKLLQKYEYECQKLLFTTTSWGNNATGTTATSWNYNTTTSNPMANVLSATGVIIKNSGKAPNTAIMGWSVLEALKNNQNVYNRIQYVQQSIITSELLASMWDLDNVYVGASVYDQGKEGATSSITNIWGGNCLIAYFAPAVGRRVATAACTLRSMRYGNPYIVKKWYDDAVDGDYIEVTTKCTPKLVATSCGFYFATIALI